MAKVPGAAPAARFGPPVPADIQSNVAAQLADCLVAVICQRLRFRADLNLRVPECEILRPTTSVKAFVRNRDFFKLPQALETGAEHGMWSFERYQKWMANRSQWHIPNPQDEAPDREEPSAAVLPLATSTTAKPAAHPTHSPTQPATDTRHPGGPIEIEPVEGGMDELIKRLT